MRIVRVLQLLLCAALLCATFAPGARADNWDRKTYVTFSDSIQVPGEILPAGTYVFKLANTNDRHIVQVWSEDESQLYATFIAIPIYTSEPPDDTYFRIDERPGDQPEAIGAWFYPGDTMGNEFHVDRIGYNQLISRNTPASVRRASAAAGETGPLRLQLRHLHYRVSREISAA